jgi:predicted SprT family Zn-dependent metalloprotease
MDYFPPNIAYLSFSSLLWKSLSKYQKKQAVIHEFCHIIVAHTYGYDGIFPHNDIWKKVMKKFGRKPSIGMRV